MKLVDVTEFYSQRGGGVRTYLTDRARVAAKHGHEHLVLAPGPRGPAPPGVRYIPGPATPYDSTYHVLWRVGRLRREIRAERPDVLEIHSPYVAAAAAAVQPPGDFRLRTLIWHSDFIDTYLHRRIEHVLGYVLRGKAPAATDAVVEPLWAHVRWITGACAMTVVATRWQRDKLRAHGVERVEHFPFGIETGRFSPARHSEARRRELLAGKRGPLIVAGARFAGEKRWDVVCDAFLALAERRPGAVLVVLGDGPERPMIERKLGGRDDVRMLGFVRDRDLVAATLASSDLFLHAAPYETFGLGVAEAIASGLPIVVPDAGGAAEQAPPGSSIVYRACDPAAATAAALQMLDLPQDELRGRARASSGNVVDVDAHFEALFARYEELMRR